MTLQLRIPIEQHEVFKLIRQAFELLPLLSLFGVFTQHSTDLRKSMAKALSSSCLRRSVVSGHLSTLDADALTACCGGMESCSGFRIKRKLKHKKINF